MSHSMHSLCLSSPHPFMMCPLFLNQLEARAALSFIAIYHATSYRRTRNSSTFIDRKVNVHTSRNQLLPSTYNFRYIYGIKIVLKIFLNRAIWVRIIHRSGKENFIVVHFACCKCIFVRNFIECLLIFLEQIDVNKLR